MKGAGDSCRDGPPAAESSAGRWAGRRTLAERPGFEPGGQFYPTNRLAGGCLRPLGHLSVTRSIYRIARCQAVGPSTCGGGGRIRTHGPFGLPVSSGTPSTTRPPLRLLLQGMPPTHRASRRACVPPAVSSGTPSTTRPPLRLLLQGMPPTHRASRRACVPPVFARDRALSAHRRDSHNRKPYGQREAETWLGLPRACRSGPARPCTGGAPLGCGWSRPLPDSSPGWRAKSARRPPLIH
jgi:hypothetical protein